MTNVAMREQAPPQSVSQFAEQSPLDVLETQALSTESRLENSIFLMQKRAQIWLFTMKPHTAP